MVDFSEVSVIIPCFNEAGAIGEVIARVKAISEEIEIIVCSDGSTDNTAEVARKAGAIVLEHTYNLGNGASVKTGASHASRPYLLFMDGDLQHPPEDIPRLLEPLPDYDMVVGARDKSCNTDSVRNIGNFCLIKVAELVSGYKIADLTSGFRAVKRSAFMEFFHLYPQRYSYPTTITLSLLSTGHFVKFEPIENICRRETGTSNISPFKDGMRFLQIILRVIMLFSPQKIFLPIALLLVLLGSGVSVLQLLTTGGIQSTGVIIVLAGVMLFLNGLLAEQISQLRIGLRTRPTEVKLYASVEDDDIPSSEE